MQITPIGLSPEPSVTVDGYNSGDPVVKATTVSSGQGAFSISGPTGGIARVGT